MEGRVEVSAHFRHEDRQGKRRRDRRIAAKSAKLGILALGRRVGRSRIRQMRGIAGRLGCGEQVRRRDGAFGIADARGLGGKADLGRHDARHRPQRPLDPADAGGAGHVVDADQRLRDPRRIARPVERGENLARSAAPVMAEPGGLGGEVDRYAADAGHRLQGSLDPAHAGGAAHAVDADGQVFGRAHAMPPRVASRWQIRLPATGRSRGRVKFSARAPPS